jgi:uncharacterized RDD family membrane protein YckC
MSQCPLCSSEIQEGLGSHIFGQPVCKKCSTSYFCKRASAFLLDYSLIWFVVPITAGFAGLSAQNVPIQNRIVGNLFFLDALKGLVGDYGGVFMLFTWIALGTWLLRDSFGGRFVGKSLMGLRAVGSLKGEAVTIGQGIKRNVVFFVPFAMLVAATQIARGRRVGERWAGTWVLLDSKRDALLGLAAEEPTSLVDGNWVAEASKLESKGNWDGARIIYRRVMEKHPGTSDAREAEQCLNALEKNVESLRG